MPRRPHRRQANAIPPEDRKMPPASPHRPSRIARACALALACGLASAGVAANQVRWQLEANVPVMCAILSVESPADAAASLAIATSCNAERYQLLLRHGPADAGLRAARSSGGPVQITGSAVTITSTRPGYALTTVELAAPLDTTRLSVTLQPL